MSQLEPFLLFLLILGVLSFEFDLPHTSFRCFEHDFIMLQEMYGLLEAKYESGVKHQRIEMRIFTSQFDVAFEAKGFTKQNFHYFAEEPGTYAFCFYSIPTRDGAKISTRISFKFWWGTQCNLYLKTEQYLLRKRSLKRFRPKMLDLEASTKTIHAEYLYFQKSQDRLREKTDFVSNSILMMIIGTLIGSVIYGYVQFRTLTRFFKQKGLL